MPEEPSDIDSFLLWADLVISQYGPNSPEVDELMRQAEREYKKSRGKPNASHG